MPPFILNLVLKRINTYITKLFYYVLAYLFVSNAAYTRTL